MMFQIQSKDTLNIKKIYKQVKKFKIIKDILMPVQPKPYKLVCPKCGYTKIVTPKSDASTMIEDLSSCPKCEVRMEIKYSDWEGKK